MPRSLHPLRAAAPRISGVVVGPSLMASTGTLGSLGFRDEGLGFRGVPHFNAFLRTDSLQEPLKLKSISIPRREIPTAPRTAIPRDGCSTTLVRRSPWVRMPCHWAFLGIHVACDRI